MKKSLLYILTIPICFLLVECSSNNTDNYKKEEYSILDIYDLYVLQSTDKYDKSKCVSCLDSIGNAEKFCDGNERITIEGENVTFSEALNKKLFTIEQVQCLMDNNIVKHYRIPYVIYKIGEIFFSIFKGL